MARKQHFGNQSKYTLITTTTKLLEYYSQDVNTFNWYFVLKAY